MCDGSGCTECVDVAAGETEYTIANGLCYHCTDANCTSCPADASTCTACNTRYALVDNGCVGCSEGCDVCIDGTVCRKC